MSKIRDPRFIGLVEERRLLESQTPRSKQGPEGPGADETQAYTAERLLGVAKDLAELALKKKVKLDELLFPEIETTSNKEYFDTHHTLKPAGNPIGAWRVGSHNFVRGSLTRWETAIALDCEGALHVYLDPWNHYHSGWDPDHPGPPPRYRTYVSNELRPDGKITEKRLVTPGQLIDNAVSNPSQILSRRISLGEIEGYLVDFTIKHSLDQD